MSVKRAALVTFAAFAAALAAALAALYR